MEAEATQLNIRPASRIPTAMSVAVAIALLFSAYSAGAQTGKWFEPRIKVFIEQHGRFVQIQEPDFHMAAARRAFEAGKPSIASYEVERAAGGIAYLEDRAAGSRRSDLKRSHAQLMDLAKALRRGEVENIERLNAVFLSAENAMIRDRD